MHTNRRAVRKSSGVSEILERVLQTVDAATSVESISNGVTAGSAHNISKATTPYCPKFEPNDTALAAFVQVFMEPLPPYLTAVEELADTAAAAGVSA